MKKWGIKRLVKWLNTFRFEMAHGVDSINSERVAIFQEKSAVTFENRSEVKKKADYVPIYNLANAIKSYKTKKNTILGFSISPTSG